LIKVAGPARDDEKESHADMFQILVGTQIPFMKYRRYMYGFSVAVMLVGLVGLAVRGGFRMGVDFTGGRLIELRFNQRISAEELRAGVDQAGIRGAEVQESGPSGMDFMIRLPAETERNAAQKGPTQAILDRLQQQKPGLTGELLREEVVGPKVGKELRGKATLAVLLALVGILLYVAYRYEFAYALGGVLSLSHDVVVALLMLAVFNKEITIQIIAALLTIAGYSINDTVVVFDRIREQSRVGGKRTLEGTMDTAVNHTLSRTLMTTATVLITVAALFWLGGEVIHDFAFCMFVGVGFGTYSSVYVASALALELGNSRDRRARVKASTVRA
jgi:preprotein translocase subunit SecF